MSLSLRKFVGPKCCACCSSESPGGGLSDTLRDSSNQTILDEDGNDTEAK